MLITLINDLLDLAKFETMNFKFNEEFFNLNELIEQAYDTMKYQASLKNIQIITDYQTKITNPKCILFGVETSFHERRKYFNELMGDKIRYMQILLNFLSNAIKFTKDGKKITIRIVLLDVQTCQNHSLLVEPQSSNFSPDIFDGIQESKHKNTGYIKFAI